MVFGWITDEKMLPSFVEVDKGSYDFSEVENSPLVFEEAVNKFPSSFCGFT